MKVDLANWPTREIRSAKGLPVEPKKPKEVLVTPKPKPNEPMFTAKTRVCETADGKLVPADDPNAAVLVATEGQQVHPKRLAGKADVSKFFTKDGKEDEEPKKAEVKTHTAAAGTERVVATAAPAKAPAVKVGKRK